MNKTSITSRPRRWRRPVPCPICGNRDIRFRKAGLTLNLVTLHCGAGLDGRLREMLLRHLDIHQSCRPQGGDPSLEPQSQRSYQREGDLKWEMNPG